MPAAARRQLVTPGEEVAHVVIQMRRDHAARGVVGAGTEVATPSPRATQADAAAAIGCADEAIRYSVPSTDPILQSARRPWWNREASSGTASAASAATTAAAICATSFARETGFGPDRERSARRRSSR
jgi:hypothetical protein